MGNYYIDLDSAPQELQPGLQYLELKLPFAFQSQEDGCEICFSRGSGGLALQAANHKMNIRYETVNDAFRALGLLSARLDLKPAAIQIEQKRRLRKMFVMFDASRNAVLNMDAACEWLQLLALMGINGFMFYTEDTYEIEGEKLFGYMRGPLTVDEIRELDAMAAALGIEMIPCIQTLAHLQRILQYPGYSAVKDTDSVLLTKQDETYDFIEKMIVAAVAPYQSSRIHIGMDEAWDLGRGMFIDRFGYEPPFEIMVEHLQRVLQITRKLDLKPMMWSDMFFRALSKTHGYYDTSIKVTDAIRKAIPEDVELIYWDYYHCREKEYVGMIKKHEEMGHTPIVAPGIHAWSRFWTAYQSSEKPIESALSACFSRKIDEVIMTVWGDDGGETDFYSALPLLQLSADMNFSGSFELQETRHNLLGTMGIDYDDWRLAGNLDALPFVDSNRMAPNVSKTLLWEDPLLGLWQPQLDGRRLSEYYDDLRKQLVPLLHKPGNERLQLPYKLADILALKADLPTVLHDAYHADDSAMLQDLLTQVIPLLIVKIKDMNIYHRKLWLCDHRPFGWEVLERRYGGLIGVLENLQFRLEAYLQGEIDRIEELEVEKQKMYDLPVKDLPTCQSAARVYSTGQIFHHLT